jgi:hypothetical protein
LIATGNRDRLKSIGTQKFQGTRDGVPKMRL